MKNTSTPRAEKTMNKKVSKNEQKSGAEIAKLTMRDQYLLEIEQIKNEIGDLDQMRAILGMSQRRLCRLLMVDPSAWTRWNKTSAPPHIYQALKWLIELKKVNPDAVAPSDVSSRLDFIQSSTQEKIENLESQMATLERAFTIAPTASAASTYALDESMLQLALKAQEERFQAEIARLQNALQQLLAPKKKKKIVKEQRKNPRKKAKTKKPKRKSPKKQPKKIVRKKK